MILSKLCNRNYEKPDVGEKKQQTFEKSGSKLFILTSYLSELVYYTHLSFCVENRFF